jgi:hypothetical protein
LTGHADGQDDAVGAGEVAVVDARVLTAAIGVEDRPWRWSSTGERHLERFDHQLGAHVIGERPADHLA